MADKQLFTVSEAATLISEVTGDDKFYIAKEISIATRNGATKIYNSQGREGGWSQVSYGIEYDESDKIPLRFSTHPIHFHQLDINSLLDILGYHSTIKEKILSARPLDLEHKNGDESAPLNNENTSAKSTHDLSLLATRAELIEAFGRFTGMESSWFKNIKDSPELLNARKVVGQGGRGQIREPLFCPFEVMKWVANQKRRKGRPVSENKAWELLEKNFYKVYCAYSVGDPRPKE